MGSLYGSLPVSLGPHYGPLIGLIGLYQVIFLEVQTEHVLRAGSSPDSF